MDGLQVCPVSGGGPEDVLGLADGSVLTGTLDGRLQRFLSDFSGAETVLDTGRRALGLDLMSDGRVVFCDPNGGVFAADLQTGTITPLATEFEGRPLALCNNPAVAADGTVYFSVSSERNSVFEATKDIVEGIPTGRLFRVRLDGMVEQLLDGLLFANGVVVAPNQQSVLVAETGAARITRLWVAGPKSGSSEIFAENMAGLPDNMSVTDDGLLLVAWVQPNGSDLARISALPFFARWLIVRLPSFMVPKPVDRLMLVLFDFEGNLINSIDQEAAGYHFVTGARQIGEWVYLGSIEEDAVARLPYSMLTNP